VAIFHIYFAFYSAFSAQIFYDAYISSSYNIFFTSFPVMLAAVFNKETTVQSTIDYPALYRSGQEDETFNIPLLFKNIGLALLQALIFFFIIVGTYDGVSTESNGAQIDHWSMSTAAYSGAVLVVNVNIALQTTTWNGYTVFFWLGSIIIWFLFFMVYANLNVTPDILGVPQALFTAPHFWAVQLLGTVACTLPDFVAKYIKKQYYPSLRDIVAEKDKGFGPKDGSDLTGQAQLPKSNTYKTEGIEMKANAKKSNSGAIISEQQTLQTIKDEDTGKRSEKSKITLGNGDASTADASTDGRKGSGSSLKNSPNELAVLPTSDHAGLSNPPTPTEALDPRSLEATGDDGGGILPSPLPTTKTLN
jgi:hypothetical protein